MEHKRLNITVAKKLLILQFYILVNTVQKIKTHLTTELSFISFLILKKTSNCESSYVNILSPNLKCV
jgi:hypothetical protein